MAVSVSLSAPRIVQLAGWLLAQHVWLTCPKDVYNAEEWLSRPPNQELLLEWNPPLSFIIKLNYDIVPYIISICFISLCIVLNMV